MTVLEVSTPPHVRRVERYKEILEFPLSKNRDTRRAEHVSSKNMFPPINEGFVVEIPSTSPRKHSPRSPGAKVGGQSRPSTAQFFEAAKTFHVNKDQNKELRQRLMESHMTFMNWRVPSRASSRSSSRLSGRDSALRPGTSLQRLNDAKEDARRSPYTKSEVPALAAEKLLGEKEKKPAPAPVVELPDKEKEVLRDWLNKASNTERLVISNLIECADRLTVTTVTGRKFRPGPAQAVRMWLKNANTAEKNIAEGFLAELELLEQMQEVSAKSPPPADSFGPLIDRSRDIGYRNFKSDKDIDLLFDSLSRELGVAVSRPFATSPRHASHFGADKTPAALWHLDQNREIRRQVQNNASNFLNPSKDRGSHFDIHPDWPNYY